MEKLVCKLRKALYGLKQAPRAWYYCLDKYLHQEGFSKGSADPNGKWHQPMVLIHPYYSSTHGIYPWYCKWNSPNGIVKSTHRIHSPMELTCGIVTEKYYK